MQPNRYLSKTIVKGLALMAATITAASSATGAGNVDEQDRLRRLGEPVTSITIAGAAYGYGQHDEPLVYVVVRGNPAVLNVIDARDGRRVARFDLEGSVISWALTVGNDRAVYVATQRNGSLYRWRPGSDQIEPLGQPIAGETHLWDLATDAGGRVYGGTYPGGKVFQFDPQTGNTRDFGRLAEGEDYVRSLAAGDGAIYAGTGFQNGQLFEIDPDTGQRRRIDLPPEAGDQVESIYTLQYTAGLLFADIRPIGRTFIYDTSTGQWIGQLAIPSPIGPDGLIYFMWRGELHTFDPQTRQRDGTGFTPRTGSPKGFAWLNLGQPDAPGLTLVSADLRGGLLLYNPQTRQGRAMRSQAQGLAVPIRSLFTGSDGRIYIGGYLAPGQAAVYDPEAGRIEPLHGIDQIEAFGEHDGIMYMGVYSGAHIYAWDRPAGWTFGSNPHRVASLYPQHRQDRPFAFTSAGQYLAIGTVPATGSLGGAISLYDPQSGGVEVFRNVIPHQSIVSLVHHDGMLIGGSSISGGLGIEPRGDKGKLFVWDIASRSKVWEGAPIEGVKGVTGLVLDDDGIVWGVAGRHLFTFDPRSRQILRTHDLFPQDKPDEPVTVWVNGYLNFHHEMLYGRALGRIFRLDPRTWQSETLIGNASYFAQDRHGRIYFARGETLFQYDPPPPAIPAAASDE